VGKTAKKGRRRPWKTPAKVRNEGKEGKQQKKTPKVAVEEKKDTVLMVWGVGGQQSPIGVLHKNIHPGVNKDRFRGGVAKAYGRSQGKGL